MRLKRPSHSYSRERRWLVYFGIGITVLMFTPAARGLVALIPIAAVWLAFRFFAKDKGAYVELLCWSYITSSLVRRVVDFHSGVTESVLLAVPLIILLVPVIYLLGRWTRVMNRDSAPFGCLLMALAYGAVLACLSFHALDLMTELPLWLLPLCFGIFLYAEREHAGELFASLERAMVGGTLFAGLYGIYQYFVLPAWDAAWMLQSEMVTIGKAEPLEVRVFSTMNAPQVLAAFLMLGILLAYRSQLRYRWPAVVAGMMALALSAARTAWLALAVGILYLVIRSSTSERIRTLKFVGACSAVLIVATLIPAVNDTLSSRFSSLSNGAEDDSAADRSETYNDILRDLTVQPFGRGIGVDDGDLVDAKHDSSIVNMLVSLGAFGSIMYVIGFSSIYRRILLPRTQQTTSLLTLQAGAVALLAETPLNNVLDGPVAFLTWSFLALALSFSDVPVMSPGPAKPRRVLREEKFSLPTSIQTST